jgi:hypothetical protein
LRPSRGFILVYLAASSAFAWITFSDDWHAIANDGIAIRRERIDRPFGRSAIETVRGW